MPNARARAASAARTFVGSEISAAAEKLLTPRDAAGAFFPHAGCLARHAHGVTRSARPQLSARRGIAGGDAAELGGAADARATDVRGENPSPGSCGSRTTSASARAKAKITVPGEVGSNRAAGSNRSSKPSISKSATTAGDASGCRGKGSGGTMSGSRFPPEPAVFPGPDEAAVAGEQHDIAVRIGGQKNRGGNMPGEDHRRELQQAARAAARASG